MNGAPSTMRAAARPVTPCPAHDSSRGRAPANRGAHRPVLHRPAPRRGFSFTEVLFAVMILGVGFIMIAAIFPVAIQQAHTASDESVSAAVAWNAMAVIQSKLADADLPAMGPPEVGETDLKFQEDNYPAVVRSFRDPQAPSVALLAKGQPNGQDRPKSETLDYRERERPENQVHFEQPKDYLWNRVKGESVVVDDKRFAWVAFYRRHIIASSSDEPAPYAQVVVVVARARETPEYGKKDVTAGNARLANLQPRPVRFRLTSDGIGPRMDQTVTFTGGDRDAVAAGAFLIVAHDQLPSPIDFNGGRGGPAPQGALNCHVFRIGNHVAGNTWELSPEAGFAPVKVAGITVRGLSNAEGYVVGRTGDGSAYGGVAQDIAVYTMIIPRN